MPSLSIDDMELIDADVWHSYCDQIDFLGGASSDNPVQHLEPLGRAASQGPAARRAVVACGRRGAPATRKELKPSKLSGISGRWSIQPAQLARLEEVFTHTRSPSFAARDALAEEFGTTTRRISSWFRNRRFRSKPGAPNRHRPSARAALCADDDDDEAEDGEDGEEGCDDEGRWEDGRWEGAADELSERRDERSASDAHLPLARIDLTAADLELCYAAPPGYTPPGYPPSYGEQHGFVSHEAHGAHGTAEAHVETRMRQAHTADHNPHLPMPIPAPPPSNHHHNQHNNNNNNNVQHQHQQHLAAAPADAHSAAAAAAHAHQMCAPPMAAPLPGAVQLAALPLPAPAPAPAPTAISLGEGGHVTSMGDLLGLTSAMRLAEAGAPPLPTTSALGAATSAAPALPPHLAPPMADTSAEHLPSSSITSLHACSSVAPPVAPAPCFLNFKAFTPPTHDLTVPDLTVSTVTSTSVHIGLEIPPPAAAGGRPKLLPDAKVHRGRGVGEHAMLAFMGIRFAPY